MPVVVIAREHAARYTDGVTRLEVTQALDTVRTLVRVLDARHPGLGQALASPEVAVAIDGQIYQGAMLQPIDKAQEVCFMPAIEGG